MLAVIPNVKNSVGLVRSFGGTYHASKTDSGGAHWFSVHLPGRMPKFIPTAVSPPKAGRKPSPLCASPERAISNLSLGGARFSPAAFTSKFGTCEGGVSVSAAETRGQPLGLHLCAPASAAQGALPSPSRLPQHPAPPQGSGEGWRHPLRPLLREI